MRKLAVLVIVVAATVSAAVASSAGAAPPSNFTCSYSGDTTVRWHSDKLNKLAISEVRVRWLDGGSNVLNSVDIVYDRPRQGGRLSWPTPAGTVEVNYNVSGTINGNFDNSIFAGQTQCLP